MAAKIGHVEPLPSVVCLDQRKHLPGVLELEAAADADRRFIYDGTPWTQGGFREYLRGGAGLVALNVHKIVIGFAMYCYRDDTVLVSKFIAPSHPAENALKAALHQTMTNNKKAFMDFPLVLELG